MAKYPKYHWLPTESAPEEYVVQIIEGHFETIDGYQKGIPTRVVLNNGWGEGRSRISSGPETMTLPTKMTVSWFSYREDTFYRGDFDLPYETIEAILSEERIQPYGTQLPLHGTFTVGLAPGGFVVVWLSANMRKRVIFKGFAQTTNDYTWEDVFDNPEFSKQQIMESTISDAKKDAAGSPYIDDPKYWQRLHDTTYTYKITVDADYRPYTISTGFADNTFDIFYATESNRWLDVSRSMPNRITIDFLFPSRIPIVPIDNINSEEMFTAFEKLSKDNSEALEVRISIEGDLLTWSYRPRLFVSNGKEEIEIKQFEFRAIDSSDLLRHLEGNKHMQNFVNQP